MARPNSATRSRSTRVPAARLARGSRFRVSVTSANKVVGKIGDGTNFDGVANHINLSGFSGITAPWVVEFWIRPGSFPKRSNPLNLNGRATDPLIHSQNSGHNEILLYHAS